jgi:hypothetical protein
MKKQDTGARFVARLLRARGEGGGWVFVVLPAEASAVLPRRGRVTVSGTMNGQRFVAMLEPDGQKSHWLRVEDTLLGAAGVGVGEEVGFELAAVEPEPEPEVPEDVARALAAVPAARATWEATTTMARVDWIHWITSAKQAATRVKRIHDACAMLAEGKKRVCCFDPSGFYSKAFRAPEAEG